MRQATGFRGFTCWFAALAVLAGLVAVLVGSVADRATGTQVGAPVRSFRQAPAIVGPSRTPKSLAAGSTLVNIAPSAAFARACYSISSTTCNALALQAIDAAHSAERLAPLVLPADFDALNSVNQVVAVTNAERQARHLPQLAGPQADLDPLAQRGAAASADPAGPAGTTWVSNWAYGYASPLAADFVWMYDDGVGSSNIDCTATNHTGCWGHRNNILVAWAGTIGAASVTINGGLSLTELLVAN
jgi:hypothetical protein